MGKLKKIETNYDKTKEYQDGALAYNSNATDDCPYPFSHSNRRTRWYLGYYHTRIKPLLDKDITI